MPRTYHTFDLIIIGGGTAGLCALKSARKLSSNVLLIHDGPTGTTCARTGCMPSKTLIHAAHLFHTRHQMEKSGIRNTEQLTPDIPAILKHVRQKRDYFVQSVREDMKKLSTCIISGRARFDSPTTIRAAGKLLHTRRTIIATGSSPFFPEKYRAFEDKIITTDSLFEQKNLPPRIAVIGMGPVGLEMAQALARLGIEVTAIERNGHLGGVADADINRHIMAILQRDMRLWMDTTPQIARAGEGLLVRSKDEMVEVDAILLTVGRKPNLGSLGLKRIGAALDSEDVPYFNRRTMQLNNLPIYIAGDATDERAVLHEAADEGHRAALHSLAPETPIRHRHTPMSVIFTQPTIAVIGDSDYAMRRNGVKIGEASFHNQGRTILEEEAMGKIRIAADESDGELRGCEMMAPRGEHLAHLMAFAIEQHMTARQLLQMPFYHPTFEEGLKTALKKIVQ